MTVSGSNAYVLWLDNTPGISRYCKERACAGATFGCTINVSQDAGFSGLPAILWY